MRTALGSRRSAAAHTQTKQPHVPVVPLVASINKLNAVCRTTGNTDVLSNRYLTFLFKGNHGLRYLVFDGNHNL